MEIWYFFFLFFSRYEKRENTEDVNDGIRMMPWFLHFSEKRKREREREKKKKERRRKKKMPLSESNHFHADNFTAEWSPFSVNAPFHWTKQ